MNRYKTDSDGTMATPIPLFASSWLALFYLLRKNLNDRRTNSSNPARFSKPEDEQRH
jgi:hypothetical protein